MEEDENSSFSQGDQWSKEKLSSLISLYFEERDLWDTTRSPTFDQRQEAFERIANSLGCDVFDVTRKVRHLRTYYAKLLRESSKKKLRRGKPWQFFDQMEFLHDHIVSRMTRPIHNTDASDEQCDMKMDNGLSASSPGVEISESSTDSSMVDQQQHSSSARVNRVKVRPVKRLKHSSRSVANSAGSGSSNVAADEMDADEIFGRHVANELKLISGMREKQFAKLQINNILFNAQFGLVKLPEHILQSLAEMDQQQQSP